METNQLHPQFVGKIISLDTSAPTQDSVEFVEDAMAKHAACVIRDASLSDEDHIRFARVFGPLELVPPGRKRISAELYDISNLTDEDEIVPPKPDGAQPTDFELFHTDSPFNSWPTKWSFLLAYVTPPEGADTQYIATRAVYDDLSPDMTKRVGGLEVDHDLFRALQRNGVEFEDEEMRKNYPRMTHPLVRTSANGRKALYMGWPGVGTTGWSEEEAHQFLDELYRFATQEKYVYSHKWRRTHGGVGQSLHHAQRDLRRATINEYGRKSPP